MARPYSGNVRLRRTRPAMGLGRNHPGLEHGFHRRLRGHCGPAGHSSGSGHVRRRDAVGRQRLHADARRADPGRRLGRRSLWPTAREAIYIGGKVVAPPAIGNLDEALTELRKRESAYCKALLQPAAAAGPAAQGEVKAFNDQLDIVKPMFESVFRKIPVGAVFDPRC
jgi:hypothetical protein